MTIQPPDLYDVLGVSRDATQAEINRAYRTLLHRYHPDTRTPGDPSQDAARDAALQAVLTAHQVLSDPGRRHGYDQRYAARPVPTGPRAHPVYTFPAALVDQPLLRAGPVRWSIWPSS